MATILVVDDDSEVLGTTWRALTRDEHSVHLAESAALGLEYLQDTRPDLLILDIMMPEMNGLELCRLLRSKPEFINLPILFLSALGKTEDVVHGLDAGGDDYIVKPFELVELNARVRALLRRSLPTAEEKKTMLQVGDLSLDARVFQASVADTAIQLTSTEYRLLEHLMRHAGEVHSVDGLLEAVWDYPQGTGDPNLVRSHIRNLRQKLEPDPGDPRYLQTVHGLGYIIQAE
jgi:DNA-binding response OmpR family regulator